MGSFIVRSENELLRPLVGDDFYWLGKSLRFFTNKMKNKEREKRNSWHKNESEVSSQRSLVELPATSSKKEGATAAVLGNLCCQPRLRNELASQRKPRTSRFKNILTERNSRTLIEKKVLVHDFLEVVDKNHMIGVTAVSSYWRLT